MSRIFKRANRRGTYYYDGRYEGKGVISLQTTQRQEALRLKAKIDAMPVEQVNPESPIETGQFEKFVSEYLNWARAMKSPNTVRLEALFLTQLGDYWKSKQLRDLTPRAADAFIAYQLNERKLRPASVNACVRTLRSIFNKGKEWNVVSINPFSKNQFVKWDQPIPTPIDPDILGKFFSIVAEKNPRYLDHFFALLETGIRREELERIRWEDIDFGTGRVIIPKSKGKKVRHVYFNTFLLDRLLLKRSQDKESVPFPHTASWVSHLFKKRIRDAGMEHHHLHDLRKTFATLMSRDVGAIQLAKYLGHASPDTTFQFYAAQEMEAVPTQGTHLKKVVAGIENKVITLYPSQKKNQSKGGK